jgi:hypothetical protein
MHESYCSLLIARCNVHDISCVFYPITVTVQAKVTDSCVDGTWKIEFSGYVMLIYGTHTLSTNIRTNKVLPIHSFRPMAFYLCPSESGANVTRLIHGVREGAKQLFGVDWHSQSGLGDRSYAVSCAGRGGVLRPHLSSLEFYS